MNLFSRMFLKKQKKTKKSFDYTYLRHPFDSPQKFTVQAYTAREADRLAVDIVSQQFAVGNTVMLEAYRVN